MSNTQLPLISVLTVVYNGVSTIESSILSIISQSYKRIQLVIIDGGSTDGTLEVLRKYERYIDYWESASDNGIYDAINKGMTYLKGDWALILGCDDLFLESLQRIAPVLKNPETIYYGNSFFTTSKKIYAGKFSTSKLCFQNICHQAIFYPRSIYSTMLYDLKYPLLADYDYNIRCWAKYKFEYIDVLVSIFNQSGSVNQTIDEVFMNTKHTVISRNISAVHGFLWWLYWYARGIVKRLL